MVLSVHLFSKMFVIQYHLVEVSGMHCLSELEAWCIAVRKLKVQALSVIRVCVSLAVAASGP